MHPEDIKAALRKRFGSVFAFEDAHDLPRKSVSDFLRGRANQRVKEGNRIAALSLGCMRAFPEPAGGSAAFGVSFATAEQYAEYYHRSMEEDAELRQNAARVQALVGREMYGSDWEGTCGGPGGRMAGGLGQSRPSLALERLGRLLLTGGE